MYDRKLLLFQSVHMLQAVLVGDILRILKVVTLVGIQGVIGPGKIDAHRKQEPNPISLHVEKH